VKATVAEAAALERVRTEKRLALFFVRGYASAGAPELMRAAREARGAANALERLGRGADAGPLLPLDELPRIEEEHDRLKRAVEVSAGSYELLAKQVEQLRAVEMRPAGRPDVIDPPVAPRRHVRPARLALAIEGAIVGLLSGALAALALALRRRRAP
jgi:hypothetical protein